MASVTISNADYPQSRRLAEQMPPVDLSAMFERAIDEQAAGNLADARAVLNKLLARWLRQKWIEVSGKVNSRTTDPEALADKLRSGLEFDRWTHGLIKTVLSAPHSNDWLHVDLLFGVVSAICFGFPTVSASKGGAV